ncbi:MAG TPA: hypothetical protein QF700_03170 [Prochlorococcus sp.]|nr:hypothetical protein [Prochlorococcus sp.]
MGKQITPNPNPAGTTYSPGDGDFNAENFNNNGTLNISDGGMLKTDGMLENYGTLQI